jgi:hypothetical protein
VRTHEEIGAPLRWAPDGSAVFYLSPTGIRRLSVRDGDDREVVSSKSVASFALSPDGKTAYTIEQLGRAHLVRVPNFGVR